VTTITVPIDFSPTHQSVIRLVVTERISTLYEYHLSHPQTFSVSLCGEHTATTGLQIADWGKPLRSSPGKWCTLCEHKSIKAR
jgi:hypothetical protein